MRNARRASYIRTASFMMIDGTLWHYDEVYGYGDYPSKLVPSYVISANLNMQSSLDNLHLEQVARLNLNLGISLKIAQ